MIYNIYIFFWKNIFMYEDIGVVKNNSSGI
jgi:hypothetical protein